ncbi:concanavalin A-like lectin/glucanase domain-containing protein [Papiliotrema laurentii]|uniref:Concanavalin A-like lectin/glucanase domain-containing protein n=1 Tax=Papiliotrema laurentii TaxID=5418 RepID=A0AAD9FJQ4_PAPLA|nr:concanavalin A-like lectin/glucanase domain-containing protein [Papiliotrema laurentii]
MLSALLALLPLASAATYPILESWKGDGFLDGFKYDPSAYDNTTNGDVFWATPSNTSLIHTTSSGTVVLKVDNETFVPYNEKRYAPKLLSKTAYEKGTVWVMDAVHMPYGCSVWPALWTQGPNWPAGGEIDIMEGVNNQTTNQMALHASDTGCVASTSASMSGNLTQSACSKDASSGAGCTIVDSATNSYGAGFAAAGGGVYVCEFGDEGVKIWFFTRSAVPSAVTDSAQSIDTGSLGTPVAFYPSSSCDVDKYLGPQTLTIDITLCGDWAGLDSILQETCGALATDQTCYTTYVINQGDNYSTAYFELNYINVYSSASTSGANATTSTSGTSASRSASPTTTLSAGAGASAAQSSGAAVREVEGLRGVQWALAAVGGVGLGMLM